MCFIFIYLTVFVGKPMYFMEAALGQFGQVGPLQVWTQMLPCAVGVGVAMVIISLIVAIYYNVIMAYCLVYLFNSFRDTLPWTVCDPKWADERCYMRNKNSTISMMKGKQTSEEQYWERAVLDITPSGLGEPGDLGEIKLDLAFFLLISWLVVLLCLVKGVKSSGKVVYFSATFPYLVLLVLLVLGLTLPGAGDGLYFLFVPDWQKLSSFTVWRRAAGQVSAVYETVGYEYFYSRFSSPLVSPGEASLCLAVTTRQLQEFTLMLTLSPWWTS